MADEAQLLGALTPSCWGLAGCAYLGRSLLLLPSPLSLPIYCCRPGGGQRRGVPPSSNAAWRKWVIQTQGLATATRRDSLGGPTVSCVQAT